MLTEERHADGPVPRPRRPRPALPAHDRRSPLPPEILTAAEVLTLLDACGDWPTGVRNRALLAVLYRGGLRLNEAMELRPKDVDRETGAVRVLCGKGGRARTVGLDEGAFAPPRPLAGHTGRLGASAGRPAVLQPHRRQTPPRLAELRAEGVDIGIISKQLGHTSIATTVRYLDHITPLAVVEAMRRRAW